ncbi:hypothetical protein PFUGPA_02464 [Plasmodium falciparum Palo Alto/Uganda]|uniref:Uncharacterized protein n=3 Tax=Plasmodium falciparum TaxID=5833 RepID=A0A024W219_PLAFA|nr:hypothetical protein PFTANZ_04762 [Plasmodium falciparum Tanzania (2000708)]ETW55702.1 hypothetical protein PFUGPA_02464 [Plasmodium falciparum Palo Alto/Uganda]ETW59309.1 hypothetical protein PFMC_04785 [Plasmodium falciparum CAMP/Malaysia]
MSSDIKDLIRKEKERRKLMREENRIKEKEKKKDDNDDEKKKEKELNVKNCKNGDKLFLNIQKNYENTDKQIKVEEDEKNNNIQVSKKNYYDIIKEKFTFNRESKKVSFDEPKAPVNKLNKNNDLQKAFLEYGDDTESDNSFNENINYNDKNIKSKVHNNINNDEDNNLPNDFFDSLNNENNIDEKLPKNLQHSDNEKNQKYLTTKSDKTTQHYSMNQYDNIDDKKILEEGLASLTFNKEKTNKHTTSNYLNNDNNYNNNNKNEHVEILETYEIIEPNEDDLKFDENDDFHKKVLNKRRKIEKNNLNDLLSLEYDDVDVDSNEDNDKSEKDVLTESNYTTKDTNIIKEEQEKEMKKNLNDLHINSNKKDKNNLHNSNNIINIINNNLNDVELYKLKDSAYYEELDYLYKLLIQKKKNILGNKYNEEKEINDEKEDVILQELNDFHKKNNNNNNNNNNYDAEQKNNFNILEIYEILNMKKPQVENDLLYTRINTKKDTNNIITTQKENIPKGFFDDEEKDILIRENISLSQLNLKIKELKNEMNRILSEDKNTEQMYEEKKNNFIDYLYDDKFDNKEHFLKEIKKKKKNKNVKINKFKNKIMERKEQKIKNNPKKVMKMGNSQMDFDEMLFDWRKKKIL